MESSDKRTIKNNKKLRNNQCVSMIRPQDLILDSKYYCRVIIQWMADRGELLEKGMENHRLVTFFAVIVYDV